MKSLLRLKPYLRPYLGHIVASGILAIPLAAIRLGPAPLAKYVTDKILMTHDQHRLLQLPFLVIGMYLVNFIIRFPHYYLMRIVIVRVNQKLKNDLFEHLLGLSAGSINMLIREPLTLLFAFGYALYMNWRLTLITLIILPPAAWVFAVTARNLKRYIHRSTAMSEKVYSALQESFTGIRVIKTFRLERYIRNKFRQRNEEYAQIILKTSRMEEVSHPMVELLIGFALAALIYFGATQVFANRMTLGDFTSFCVAFGLMMNPLRSMNDINIKLSQCAGACERIFEVFDWRPNLHESADPKPIQKLERGISIQNVSFAFPDTPQRTVLKNINIEIPRGRVIALVGPSGAGKSSLVSLLPRIFDVTSGSIRIDGQDIRELKLENLRQMIAVVSQDVFLFNDTIEENIRCGRLNATPEEIREAARRAHALEFIQSAPMGFQAVIGDRGQKLSGGERQRISIARAFLREAPILILDEATSSLDNASERAVQEALEELMKNRTTLVIAHRLSTIRQADQILVIKEGEILEKGRHDELMSLQGEYARLYGQSGPAILFPT